MSLEVSELSISIDGRTLVDRVSFTAPAGARIGLIGSSGSGKSLTAAALLGLLPETAEVSGSIHWKGQEMVGLRERDWARVRGGQIGLVLQDPLASLDQVRRIGAQIVEAERLHGLVARADARDAAVEAARRVGLPYPEEIVRRYPHQLSGGQRQRVAIAMALSARPQLLVADEPTTALDVTVQAEILSLLRQRSEQEGMGLIFITHDLAVLAQIATEAVVLEDARVAESGPLTQLLHRPASAATQRLLRDAATTAFTDRGMS